MGEGAIEIELPEAELSVSEEHLSHPAPAVALHCIRPTQARKLVAEYMILAGEVAGRIGGGPPSFGALQLEAGTV